MGLRARSLLHGVVVAMRYAMPLAPSDQQTGTWLVDDLPAGICDLEGKKYPRAMLDGLRAIDPKVVAGLTTGSARSEDVQTLPDAGVPECLTKPYGLEQLSAFLARLLAAKPSATSA